MFLTVRFTFSADAAAAPGDGQDAFGLFGEAKWAWALEVTLCAELVIYSGSRLQNSNRSSGMIRSTLPLGASS